MLKKVLRANLVRMIRTEKLFDRDDHLLVAVSGGFDSLHLLQWLVEGRFPADIKPTVSAAYVNHQFRTDADEEENLVAQTFARFSEQLKTTTMTRLDWPNGVPETAVEEVARDRRYEALIAIAREVGANKIVTAHHQGDQVETILYKLTRGSRLTQLRGMSLSSQLRGDIDLIRPLLRLKKTDFPDLVDHPVKNWINDYTNDNQYFARNRLRHDIIPALREVNAEFDEHIIGTADQLSALFKLANGTLNLHVKAMAENRTDWHLDDDVLLLVMQTWLGTKHLYNISDKQLRQVIQLMRNSNVARGQVNLSDGWVLERFESTLKLVRP
jgi:tRNA(Ile)-lysidine synthetase-like protein